MKFVKKVLFFGFNWIILRSYPFTAIAIRETCPRRRSVELTNLSFLLKRRELGGGERRGIKRVVDRNNDDINK